MKQLETRFKQVDVLPMVKHYMDAIETRKISEGNVVVLPFQGPAAPSVSLL
jgi:dihydroxyacid dehydratase/phosphogluconate dehydratase